MSEFENELYREELNKAIEHTVGKEALAGTTVLVTGATGEIGGFIVDTLMQFNANLSAQEDGLLHKDSIRIIACGRDVDKLQRRFEHWKQGGAVDAANLLEFARYDMLEESSDELMKSLLSDGKENDQACGGNRAKDGALYVIHAAGNAYPSAFVNNPEETVKGNVLGTARLMELAVANGCKKFLYVSSGEVYSVEDEIKDSFFGKANELLRNSVDAGNEVATSEVKSSLVVNVELSKATEALSDYVLQKVQENGPRSSYPLSKVAAEMLCMAGATGEDNPEMLCMAGTMGEDHTGNGNLSSETAQAPMECVVTRLCHTFGPGAKNTDDRAHAEFARKAAAGEEIVLNSAGSQLRSYNYIVDSVSGILSVLINGENREAYDICSPGNTVTIRELAGLFAKAGGTSVVVKEPDEKQKALQSPISKQVLDSSRLEALGWSKAYELEDAVNNYVKILRG